MSNILLKTVFGRALSKTVTLNEAYEIFASKNLIEIGELAELAISKKSGVAQCSKNTPEIDLVTGKQVKHAQTNPAGNSVHKQGSLIAWCSIKNTKAPILLVVTERLTKKQYFFHMRYSSYKHVRANAVGIPFDLDGTPRRNNRWWKHEIATWNELCSLAK